MSTPKLIQSSSIGNHIGKDEYKALKAKDELTEEEMKSVEFYEELQKKIQEGEQKAKEHLLSLVDKDFTAPDVEITAEQLYKLYVSEFKLAIGKSFDPKNEEQLNNLLPLIFYFSKDERFFECKNLSNLSQPSFEKGLLIIGGYGNGKTTSMLLFEKIFKKAKGITFKGYTTNDVVTMYEACENDASVSEFDKIMKHGKKYFDDLGSEREASRYGKVNLMKEILEARYINRKEDKKMRTYITMNYAEEYPEDVEKALLFIGKKYGSRMYDRIFEMFNIIQFKGKSLRR
jgi:DNA replication protein DnaC